MSKQAQREQLLQSLLKELENRTSYVPYKYTGPNVSNDNTVELVITGKGYRKIFATIVVGSIVAHYSLAVIEGVYTAVHTRSKKNNGLLWRFETRMNEDLNEKRREAEEARFDRETQ